MRRGAGRYLVREPRGTSRVAAACRPGPVLARAVPARTLTGLAAVAALACACSSQAPAATFRPAGSVPDGRGNAQAGPAGPSRRDGPLAWPPFGRNVRIVMPGWLPPDKSQVPAVIAAKDFLLAFLYAEYTGGSDSRWQAYATGDVVSALKTNLAEPSVTTESFSGTIRFSKVRAFADPGTQGAVDVSECFDNADSVNTSIATGKPVEDSTPPSQHYYRNTDVLAKGKDGHWRVVQVYPVIYYPQAKECKG